MELNKTKINGLLLAGGQSSRMGSPKHLLKLDDGCFVYEHLLGVLQAALSADAELYVSLRDRESPTLPSSTSSTPWINYKIIHDIENENQSSLDIGPAAGLLAAHREYPTAHWLVLACDYPLMRSDELSRLISQYAAPVTCMHNDAGFAEPLVAVWSPEALQKLAENVAKGQTGPNRTIKMLRGKMVKPMDDICLMNTNTKAEWEEALEHLDDARGKQS